MKKIITLACSLLVIVACKNQTEEVKIDQTPVENPADSIVPNDTVASVSPTTESVENEPTVVATTAVNEKATVAAKTVAKANYAAFGGKIVADQALTKEEMLKKYKSMKAGDTVAVKFKSMIKEVCKKKGCWMSMELPNEKESFVRFKDYGFFVPLNADNSEAIVSGRAYIDEISVAQLKHYAKDGGKSQDEIDKITEPKITYAFQADGVLIKE